MGHNDEFNYGNSMQNRKEMIMRNRKHHLHENINRLKLQIEKLDPRKDDTLIEQMYAEINILLEVMAKYHESQYDSGDDSSSRTHTF